MKRVMRAAVAALVTIAAGSPDLYAAPKCKDYKSCKAAVEAWCKGRHSGADRDNDGVPCENVCGQSSAKNVAKVKTLKLQVGC